MTVEYVCCECGVGVYATGIDKTPTPPLCATCLHVPGWMDDPKLKAIFGRGDEKPKEETPP